MDGPSGSTRPDDASLVVLAVGGDRDAFAELVGRHRPMVAGLTRRLLDDEHLAADAVQEAIVVALVSLHRLRSPDRFGSWLAGIALNIARRWLRQSRPVDPFAHVVAPSENQQPDELAEASIVAAQVRAAIEELPPGQRHATLLFYLQGLSYRETADELNITVGAVKSRLHQARRALVPRFAQDRTRQEETPMTETAAPTEGWVDVSIADVRAEGDDPPNRLHVVLLEDESHRRIPIWIGPNEAMSLAISLEAEEMPRPLTYEFTAGLLGAASARVIEVRLTELIERTYYAIVVIDGPAGQHELDARPSDALNLALVTDAPIRVAAAIFDDARTVDRAAWQDYPGSASQLVREMREHLRKAMAPAVEPPDS